MNTNYLKEALITSVHKGLFGFTCTKGTGFAKVKRGNYPEQAEDYPTVGDKVALDYRGQDHSLILKTYSRRSLFVRADSAVGSNKRQVVAANFDFVFILQALGRDFNLRRLERYLSLAWESGGLPVVLLTKIDEVPDYSRQLAAAEGVAIGAKVHGISAVTGVGINQLDEYLQPNKTIVLLGSSGVGKSTLLNYLVKDNYMDTANVRAKDQRGQHTTSHRQLIFLQEGTQIIDTPGMRELGMWDSSEGLEKSFSDISNYLGHCKFSDCQHQKEPGCRVKAALQAGELSPERWESYLKLAAEARFTEDKEGYLRQKEQRLKEISQFAKQLKQPDYRVVSCTESFICEQCGKASAPETAGSKHRNHCPHCLASKHVDNRPGDRAALCRGTMVAVSLWSKGQGEWAIIHRCRSCGVLKSNRVAADDNQEKLLQLIQQVMRDSPFPIK
ncbi:ribosome small subunit-dependent GTPase A [Enterococcus sp. AZ163]|uniref:ribosome small subunit-dependent GTPase A n=1 Tax=Enterococcus sp. AZ163 TaxID=2774638 RepID=UPI003D291BF6